jgi:hypothetical protein
MAYYYDSVILYFYRLCVVATTITCVSQQVTLK